MLNKFFGGIFDAAAAPAINVGSFLVCLGASLVIGAVLALVYTYRNSYTKSFLFTLGILPAIVCVVIMMVNGNIGTGVAVAGAFSLVRFRSAPGNAKEIGMIFLAMCAGIITGMGYIGYAVLFTVILCVVSLIANTLNTGNQKKKTTDKVLRITIPEDLDYNGVFDDIIDEYTLSHELVQVKTTNMGSLFRLTYNLKLKNQADEKELIDKLRCRNGNLEISVSCSETGICEL